MPDLTDLVRIREPDKEPTTYEKIKTTEEFYPELVQQIRELEAQVGRDQGQDQGQDQGDGDEDDVIIRLEALQQKEEVLDYMDSSPPPPNYVDSSDVESNAGSLDSIQRNADFVQF
jgi:hypothetical protein